MGDVFLVSSGSRTNIPLAKKNFASRLGLAYGLSSKTIVRAGYGVFWIPTDVSFALNPINDMVNTPGTTYTGTVDGAHPYNSISLPFPNGISPPPGRTLGTEGTQQFLTQVVQSITEVEPFHHPEGYVQQWNLSVDRQLPAGFSFSLAYVGSKGTIWSSTRYKAIRFPTISWRKQRLNLQQVEVPTSHCSNPCRIHSL